MKILKRGIKAVTGTDVIEASIIFIGLTISTIIDITDAGGTSKLYKTVKVNNRLQFSVVDFDPSIRYIMWSIFISVIFSSTAQYACIQTQAERYMCIKDTRSAKNQCVRLQTKIISRSFQMYPLFGIETSRRFSGYAGLFIACMLSATLNTFSSGANSMATVILEDISKQLTKKYSIELIIQMFGVFAASIFNIYFLGLFSSELKLK
ncbi:unnamed protein product [Adineta steineri]|uniref:Uncharacterized protein n=1 Tax=Adineta steineri TaxID=433720 RepID=A0A814SNT8_9BILA|nr:unnamed protein product [Adineta steineri]